MNPEEIRSRIGQNIIYLRMYYGISRISLAKLVNIPVHRLRRIENGDIHAELYDFQLKRIASVFAVTVDKLINEKLPAAY